MRDLNYQLKGICNRNKDGSYSTQAARQRNLDLMANHLHDLGFRHLKATGLKPKCSCSRTKVPSTHEQRNFLLTLF
jgi:Phage integrase, N-terminal